MFMTRLLTVLVALPIFAGALLFLPRALWALFLLPVLGIASWEWAGLRVTPVRCASCIPR
jgi:CDP-diglyceride synthetase